MKKTYLFLLFILFIAAILRFCQLNTIPPSLTWDEAAWGYNAYTLGIDGKDEFGRFLPHDYLESFGDFKPPMYAYLAILPVKLFGLTEFAVRFPSAFFGTLTVLLTFLLVLEIFKSREKSHLYALTTSFVLAVSPWHINLSRAAFEANLATFFLVLGVFLFLKWVNNKKDNFALSLSAASFVAAIYTFNSVRVVGPLLFFALSFAFWKVLWARKRTMIIAIIVGLILLSPTLAFLASPNASLRFKEVNIFSDVTVVDTANKEIKNDGNAMWSNILHNRRVAFSFLYLRHYFDNLTPEFLFIKGDGNPKFSTQDIGQLFLWDLPFFVIGIFLLLYKKEGYWWVVPVWLLLSIVPAATARETPHALRIESGLPTFQIFVAYGIVSSYYFLQKKASTGMLRAAVAVVITLFLLNALYYLHGYYTHYAREFSGEWQYGYKESIRYVESVKNDYDKINVTTSLGRPYIYYLFYMKKHPSVLRENAVVHRDAFGFVDVLRVENIYFTDKLTKEKMGERNLFIAPAGTLPAKARLLRTFNLLNGSPVLIAYTI